MWSKHLYNFLYVVLSGKSLNTPSKGGFIFNKLKKMHIVVHLLNCRNKLVRFEKVATLFKHFLFQ